jgi:hypothetical protein
VEPPVEPPVEPVEPVEPLVPPGPAPVVSDGGADEDASIPSESIVEDADADEEEDEDDGEGEDDDDDVPVPSVSPIVVAAPGAPLLRPVEGSPGSQANARIAGRRSEWWRRGCCKQSHPICVARARNIGFTANQSFR